tara:strand:+ start:135 stop:383 length:249 start_codon:yes stop_codon:yes gene_type:complete
MATKSRDRAVYELTVYNPNIALREGKKSYTLSFNSRQKMLDTKSILNARGYNTTHTWGKKVYTDIGSAAAAVESFFHGYRRV